MQINTPLPTISIERNGATSIAPTRNNTGQGGSRNSTLTPPPPPKSIEPAITQISRELTEELHTVEEADIDSRDDSIEELVFVDSDGDGEITINDEVEVIIVDQTVGEELAPETATITGNMDNAGAAGDAGDIGAVGSSGAVGITGSSTEEDASSSAGEVPEEHPRVRMLTIPLKFLIDKISGLVEIIDKLKDPESQITESDINEKLMNGIVEMMMVQMYYMNRYMMDQMQNAPDYALSAVYVPEPELFV